MVHLKTVEQIAEGLSGGLPGTSFGSGAQTLEVAQWIEMSDHYHMLLDFLFGRASNPEKAAKLWDQANRQQHFRRAKVDTFANLLRVARVIKQADYDKFAEMIKRRGALENKAEHLGTMGVER